MNSVRIAAIAHYLPSGMLTGEAIGAGQPGWDMEKLNRIVGIRSMPVSGEGEFSSHMAVSAARRLLDDPKVDTDGIDYLILVTQSPDFPLPTTACLVQDALGLPQNIGAVDVRLGCSGYLYGLGLAKGLVASGQAKKLLLLTSDVLTKLVNSNDKVTRPSFGDAATATLVVASEGASSEIGSFVYGTDGTGAGALVVPNGSLGDGRDLNEKSGVEQRSLDSQGYDVFMDGATVFNFTSAVVPALVDDTLAKAGWAREDVDLFVFHQTNQFLINHLRKKLGIDPIRFWMDMEEVGNTGPSTIPLALSLSAERGVLRPGMKVLLAGFGIGLSWAGCALTW
jgi:3-oxoacyl-[acyl-carrier-protein] synthase-3